MKKSLEISGYLSHQLRLVTISLLIHIASRELMGILILGVRTYFVQVYIHMYMYVIV